MSELDARMHDAAGAIRRLADASDADAVLEQIVNVSGRRRWAGPVIAVGAGTAILAAVVVSVLVVRSPGSGPLIGPEPTDAGQPRTEHAESPTPITSATGTATVLECGAADLSEMPEAQAGLPEPVQAMRRQIASAAVRCDFKQLSSLADTDGIFTASFGGATADAEHFRQSVDLREMRRLLDMPYAIQQLEGGQVVYAWPSAYIESTDEAWEALYGAGLATPDDRARMEEFFGGWVGMRHGITADGDWIFYVGGD